MANRNFDPINVLGKSRVLICGSFRPNGADAPTSKTGNGFTVDHVGGTNTYQVTLQDSYNGYDCVICSAESATAGVGAQLVLEPTVTGPGVFSVGVTTGGAASNDLAADTDTRIHFIAVLKNTTANF